MGEQDAAQLTRQMLMMKQRTRTPSAQESDSTTAFEREIDELASAMEELEDILEVQDVEDLTELSESMSQELAIKEETLAKL